MPRLYDYAASAAKKSFIIIGASDCFMILGVAIVWIISGTLQMDRISIDFASGNATQAVIAFLCLVIAAFAKAGKT